MDIEKLFELNDYKHIIEYYNIRKYELSRNDAILFGSSLLKMRKYNEASKYFKWMSKKFPNDGYIKYCISVCKFNSRDYFECYYHITQCIKNGYDNFAVRDLMRDTIDKINELF